VNDSQDVTKIKSLYEKLCLTTNRDLEEGDHYMVEMGDLKNYLAVESIREVWRLLFLAQKAGVIKVDREIIIEPTFTRNNELEKWNGYRITSPTIESVFKFSAKIMSDSKYYRQTHFEGDDLDNLANEAMAEHITSKAIFWTEYLKNNKERSQDEIVQKLREDFEERCGKNSPEVYYKTFVTLME